MQKLLYNVFFKLDLVRVGKKIEHHLIVMKHGDVIIDERSSKEVDASSQEWELARDSDFSMLIENMVEELELEY